MMQGALGEHSTIITHCDACMSVSVKCLRVYKCVRVYVCVYRHSVDTPRRSFCFHIGFPVLSEQFTTYYISNEQSESYSQES